MPGYSMWPMSPPTTAANSARIAFRLPSSFALVKSKSLTRGSPEKYPQAYFGGAVALAKSIKWETAEEDLSDGAMTPDEIMDELEQRVGPQGRKLFERFLRQVNKLQAQQQLEAQARTGDNGGR